MSIDPNRPTLDSEPSTNGMDAALNDFQLSKQAERVVELVNANKLNKEAGYSIDALTDNLKRFELNLSGERTSTENKTAGMVAMVQKTAHDHAFADIDPADPASQAKTMKVDNEVREVIKAVYDDPTTNPLHGLTGGFYDIDRAKKGLSLDRRANATTFSPNILVKHQLMIMEAVSTLPSHLQQHAIQSVKQAADDASKQNVISGQKTDSVPYVKSVIESNLRSYDTFNRKLGYQEIAGGQEQAFDRAMYDGKGALLYASTKNDRKAASNNPPAQITTKSGDSYTSMMIDGLNAESQNLHKAYGKAHTFSGDRELSDQALNLLDNIGTFNDYLDERVADDNRDRLEGRELNELHNQTKDLIDNILELSKELPFRNLELSRTADRTKQEMEGKDRTFQRAQQETVYKEAQESNTNTARSIPRSVAIR